MTTEIFSRQRSDAADAEFEAYDFGEAVVNSFDGWEYTSPGTEYTRTVWLDNPEDPDGDDIKGHFVVTFASDDSLEIVGATATINGDDFGRRMPIEVQEAETAAVNHPLPVGTKIKANKRQFDNGVMSWDDSDTVIERVAEAGSVCHVWDVEKGNDGYRYQVTYIPSEVWNVLEEADFAKAGEFDIVELGKGALSDEYNEYFNNPVRDPEAVRKIEAELGDQPKM